MPHIERTSLTLKSAVVPVPVTCARPPFHGVMLIPVNLKICGGGGGGEALAVLREHRGLRLARLRVRHLPPVVRLRVRHPPPVVRLHVRHPLLGVRLRVRRHVHRVRRQGRRVVEAEAVVE